MKRKHESKENLPLGKSVPKLSATALARLSVCYQVVLRAGEDGRESVSSAYLAGIMKVDETLIRKDMAVVGIAGKPRVGYMTGEMIERLQYVLGLSEYTYAILIGAGYLGSALLRYPGFAKYGLRIAAAFDSDYAKIGQKVGDYVILPMEKCKSIISTFKVQIAILSIPVNVAQETVDWLVTRGIMAIWNFVPVQLKAPPAVIIRNENLAVGLAQLIHQVRRTERELE